METHGTIRRHSKEREFFTLSSNLDFEDTSTDNNPEVSLPMPLANAKTVILVLRPSKDDYSEFFTEGDIEWSLCTPPRPDWPWMEEVKESDIPEEDRGRMEEWLGKKLTELCQWFA